MTGTFPKERHPGAGKRVFVGLSGGVDSSVAAALLQQEGYDVTGVFIKGWHPDFLPCTWKEDRQDAMRVAAALGIPFKTLDLGKEYYEHVIEPLLDEYRSGRTPNPDVLCNRYIKFGAFLSWAIDSGADFVATGHYARIKYKEGLPQLLAGVDVKKDQSYFLWALTQEDLARSLFPIGAYEKSAVRSLAATFDLPTKAKPDSQGVCFIGKLDMKEFLGRYIESEPGEVLDTAGHTIGEHDGAAFYTVGQRHGFSVRQQSPAGVPHYVVEKDMRANTITVAPTPRPVSAANAYIHLKAVSWVNKTAPRPGTQLDGRFRYRQPLQPYHVISGEGDRVVLEPVGSAEYVPQGQSLVLYDGEVCLGGGIIA